MSNIPRAVQEAGMVTEGIMQVVNNELAVLMYAPLDYREAVAEQMLTLEDTLRGFTRQVQQARAQVLGFDEKPPTNAEGDMEGSVLLDIANIDKSGYRPERTPVMPWMQNGLDNH